MRFLSLPFDQVLRISLEASLLVMLVLCAQWTLGKRLSPTLRCTLWGLVIIRMAMPVLPESRWSIFNLLTPAPTVSAIPKSETTKALVIYGTAPEAPIFRSTSPAMVSVSQRHVPSFNSYDAMIILWVSGLVLLIARLGVGGIWLRRKLERCASPVETEVLAQLEECCRQLGIRHRPRLCVSQSISSPALCGIVRPMLVLPAGFSEELSAQELRFVLLHELVHLKRRDVLAGMIFWIFNAIHWFNPLLWYAASRFRADREIACDAAVLALTRPQEQPAYGQTILKLLETLSNSARLQPGLASAAMLQNRSTLKRRLAAIAHPWSPTRSNSVIAIVVILVLSLLTLTRAQQQPATPAAPSETVTRVYDVRDLIVDITDFDSPPQMSVDEWGFPATSGRPFVPIKSTTEATAERDKLVASLITRIERSIALETWKDNGGQIGVIRTIPNTGQLVITQTPENLELIGALLDAWRSERALQVTVESRFLSKVAELPKFAGKWLDENGTRRWSEFLSDEQVSQLLKIVQSDRKTTTLTAPRLTLFDHQRAYIVVSTETAYVASVTPKKQDNGIIKYDPLMKNVPSGVLHDCRATVSDDKQNVKVELHTRLNRLLTLESVVAPESNPKEPAFYQVPHVSSAKIDTTIDIPDGKTVLLEIIPQMKTPNDVAPAEHGATTNAQNSIPFLSRLNPDEAMLVLIKPTVIVQREKEQQQFPLLQR